MIIMEGRSIHLVQCLEGLKRTGMSLIEYDGHALIPSITSDDLGIYVLIPKLALWFNLTIDQAINLFFYGLLSCAVLISFIGFFMFYKSISQRTVAGIYLVGATVFAFTTLVDVYIAYFVGPMMLVPWFLFFFTKTKKNHPKRLLYLFIAGIVIGFLHYVRAYSALACLIFIVTLILLMHHSYKKKLIFLTTLFIGLLIPVTYFKYTYNSFLKYSRTVLKIEPPTKINHIFWHTVYVGFGFLSFRNKDAIRYDDKCAFDKVLSINPSITLDENDHYEAILKKETFNVITTQFPFVVLTIFAKFGVLLYFLLRYANVGLVALFLRPVSWRIELPFFCAFAVSSIFPLIAVPTTYYTAGFITFALLYALVSINLLLDKRLSKETF